MTQAPNHDDAIADRFAPLEPEEQLPGVTVGTSAVGEDRRAHRNEPRTPGRQRMAIRRLIAAAARQAPPRLSTRPVSED